MKTYRTNSIWGIEPRNTDTKSKKDLDCKCSICNEVKTETIFIYLWNDDEENDNYKYCEDCSNMRFECDYEFKVVR